MFSGKSIRPLSLPSSLLVIAFTLTTVGSSQTSKDSNEVSGFLSDLKTEAVQLWHDAEVLKSFTRSARTWETHAAGVEEIKRHVNNAGQMVTKLGNAKANASSWQQQSVDRMTLLLKELASDTTATIEHPNQKPRLVHTSPYTEYVDANYEVASNLAEFISDHVDYGKSKAGRKSLPPNSKSQGASFFHVGRFKEMSFGQKTRPGRPRARTHCSPRCHARPRESPQRQPLHARAMTQPAPPFRSPFSVRRNRPAIQRARCGGRNRPDVIPHRPFFQVSCPHLSRAAALRINRGQRIVQRHI